jgi:ADP-ribose pyrophosphatase YjhB (NUDIX family)
MGHVRDWLVAGALIERGDEVLLVRNRRRDGSHDWTPPGGVIGEGEDLLEGLAREVLEETGLVVTGWDGPRYEVMVAAHELGWRLRVEVWAALGYTGTLTVGDDPDGIVVDARFVPRAACAGHLETVHAWVREPFGSWLEERWVGSRRFDFEVTGSDRASMVVTRR